MNSRQSRGVPVQDDHFLTVSRSVERNAWRSGLVERKTGAGEVCAFQPFFSAEDRANHVGDDFDNVNHE